MTTLPPAGVKKFPEDSLENKVYSIVESFKDNIPVMNDRYRLGYNLYKLVTGEGDPPEVIVKNSKLHLENITEAELAKKLSEKLKDLTGKN